MSARKAHSGFPTAVHGLKTRLSLPATAIQIRKNGLEFRTANLLAVWKEMVIDLETPFGKSIHCSGVIVACDGNRHQGYVVSMVFTQISKQALAALAALSSSPLN
jgi:hypothetical protein